MTVESSLVCKSPVNYASNIVRSSMEKSREASVQSPSPICLDSTNFPTALQNFFLVQEFFIRRIGCFRRQSEIEYRGQN